MIAAIIELIQDAKLNGFVSDQEIKAKIRHLKLKRKIVGVTDPINHQRSMWLNKEGSLEVRLQQVEARKKDNSRNNKSRSGSKNESWKRQDEKRQQGLRFNC